jgi:hypothetical protein
VAESFENDSGAENIIKRADNYLGFAQQREEGGRAPASSHGMMPATCSGPSNLNGFAWACRIFLVTSHPARNS